MDYKEYKDLCSTFRYSKPTVKDVLRIFERSGSHEVVTHELVGPDMKVKDYLIESEAMKQGLGSISYEIDQIMNSPSKNFGSHFYISKYGGSKTQFIAMLEDELVRENPKAIPIIIENVNSINGRNLFNKIVPSIYQKLNEEIGDRSKAHEKFLEIQNIVSEIQTRLRGAENKAKILNLIKDITRDSEKKRIKKKAQKIRELTVNIQIADDEKVMELLSKVLEETSKLDFIYVFLFDEVDLWFREEKPIRFSKKLNEKTRIVRKLLDLNKSGSNLYYVFCCPGRIINWLNRGKETFENSSPVASRFISIYNNAETSFDDGSYGEKTEEAIYKIGAYYDVARISKIKKNHLTAIVDSFTSKYKNSSRRVFNAKLLNLLNAYKTLRKNSLIEGGLSQIKSGNWTDIGNTIPRLLPKVFDELGYKWIREEIPVDPTGQKSSKRIDGKFIVGETNPKTIYTEVKTSGKSKFPKRKIKQAVDMIHFRKEDNIQIILLVFGNFTLNEVNEKIGEYINENSPWDYKPKYANKIHPVIMKKSIAFAPLIELYKFIKDQNIFQTYAEGVATWVDELTTLRNDLFRVWQETGIIEKLQPPRRKLPEKKREKQEEEEEEFDPLTRKALTVLVTLENKDEYTKSGWKRKTTVHKRIRKLGYGIEEDLEQIYTFLEDTPILLKTTEKSIKFSKDFLEKEHKLSGKEFKQYCLDLLAKEKEFEDESILPFAKHN